MPIDIHFLRGRSTGDGGALGEIRLNGFVEHFEAPLGYWAVEDYERQWAEGLRLLLEGAVKSCLITAMYDPKTANFIVWWPIYRDGDRAVVQNQILFMKNLKHPFDVLDPYRSIEGRVSTSKDGEPISEWIVEII